MKRRARRIKNKNDARFWIWLNTEKITETRGLFWSIDDETAS